MQMSTAVETENGEMIVKRVSVPVGLEELMEGLTKEVLLKKPKDIYLFASEYFARLLSLRESGNYEVGKQLRSVQSVTRQISKPYLVTKNVKPQPKQVVREKSPPKQNSTSKRISLMRKQRESNEKKENEPNIFRSKKAISCDETSSPRNEEMTTRAKLRERSLSTNNSQNARQKRNNYIMAQNSLKRDCSNSKDGKIAAVPTIIGGSLAAVAVISSKYGPQNKDIIEKNKTEEVKEQVEILKENENGKESESVKNIAETKNILEENSNIIEDKKELGKEFVETDKIHTNGDENRKQATTCIEQDSLEQTEDKLPEISKSDTVSEEKSKMEAETIEKIDENVNNIDEIDNIIIENKKLSDENVDKESKQYIESENVNNVDENGTQTKISNTIDQKVTEKEPEKENDQNKSDIEQQKPTSVNESMKNTENETDNSKSNENNKINNELPNNKENSYKIDKTKNDMEVINNSATESILLTSTNTNKAQEIINDKLITTEIDTQFEKDTENQNKQIEENSQLSIKNNGTVSNDSSQNQGVNVTNDSKIEQSENNTKILSNENEIKTIEKSSVEIVQNKNSSVEDKTNENAFQIGNKIENNSDNKEKDSSNDVLTLKESEKVNETLENKQLVNETKIETTQDEIGTNKEEKLNEENETAFKIENTNSNEIVEDKSDFNNETEKIEVKSQESVPVKDDTIMKTTENNNNKLDKSEKEKSNKQDTVEESKIINKSNEHAIVDGTIKSEKTNSVLEQNKQNDKSHTEKKGNSKPNSREKSPVKKLTEKNEKFPKLNAKTIKTRSLSNENLIKNENLKENIRSEKQMRRIKSVDTLMKNKTNTKISTNGLKLKADEKTPKTNTKDKQSEEMKEHVINKNAENESNKRKSAEKSRTKRSISMVAENIENKPIHKQSSFDIAKLKSEIDNVETVTKFKSSYNPYILRQEIKQASKNADKNEKGNMFTDVTAAIKIQSLWRGFIARKHHKTHKNKPQQLKNVELTVKEKEHNIAQAVILIQKMWRGFHIRKIHRKTSLFGNVVENTKNNTEIIKSAEDYKTGDHKSALKIQSLWRGYQVRKNIMNVERKLRALNDGNSKELNNNDILNAATKIQAGVRGYLQRKKNKNHYLGKITEENAADEENLIENTEKKLDDNEIAKVLTQLDSIEVPKNSPEIPSLTRCETVEEPECVKVVNNTNLTKDDNNNNDLTSLEREVKETVNNITSNLQNHETSSFNIEELKKEIQKASELNDISTSPSKTVTNNSINALTNSSITERNQSENPINKISSHREQSNNNVNNLNSMQSILIDKKIDPDTINDVYENAPTRPVTSDTVITNSGYENNQYDENLVKLQTNSKVENVNVLANEKSETQIKDNVLEKEMKTDEEKSADKDNVDKKFNIEQLKKDLEETNGLLSIIPNWSDSTTVANDKLVKDSKVIDDGDTFCSEKINLLASKDNKIKNDVEILSEKIMEQNNTDNNRKTEENHLKTISDGNDSSLSTDSADSIVTVIPKTEHKEITTNNVQNEEKAQENGTVENNKSTKSNFNIDELRKEVELAGIKNPVDETDKISSSSKQIDKKTLLLDNDSAAIKIQSAFRGYRVRRDLPKTMNEKRNTRELFDIKEEHSELKDADTKNEKFSENYSESDNKKQVISLEKTENKLDNNELTEITKKEGNNDENMKVGNENMDGKTEKQKEKLLKSENHDGKTEKQNEKILETKNIDEKSEKLKDKLLESENIDEKTERPMEKLSDSKNIDEKNEKQKEKLVDIENIDGKTEKQIEKLLESANIDETTEKSKEKLPDSENIDGKTEKLKDNLFESENIDEKSEKPKEKLPDSKNINGKTEKQVEKLLEIENIDGETEKQKEKLLESENIDKPTEKPKEKLPDSENIDGKSEKLTDKLFENENIHGKTEKPKENLSDSENIDEKTEKLKDKLFESENIDKPTEKPKEKLLDSENIDGKSEKLKDKLFESENIDGKTEKSREKLSDSKNINQKTEKQVENLLEIENIDGKTEKPKEKLPDSENIDGKTEKQEEKLLESIDRHTILIVEDAAPKDVPLNEEQSTKISSPAHITDKNEIIEKKTASDEEKLLENTSVDKTLTKVEVDNSKDAKENTNLIKCPENLEDSKKIIEEGKLLENVNENQNKNCENVKSNNEQNLNASDNKENNENKTKIDNCENGKLVDGKNSENKKKSDNTDNDKTSIEKYNEETYTNTNMKNKDVEDNVKDNNVNKGDDYSKNEETTKINARNTVNVKDKSNLDNQSENDQKTLNKNDETNVNVIKEENDIEAKALKIEEHNESENKNNSALVSVEPNNHKISSINPKDNTNVLPSESTTEESSNTEVKLQLLHTGEFHDTVVIPLALSQMSNEASNNQETRTVSQTSDFHEEKVDNGTQTVVNTSELCDTALPLAVQLNEAAPGQVFVIIQVLRSS